MGSSGNVFVINCLWGLGLEVLCCKDFRISGISEHVWGKWWGPVGSLWRGVLLCSFGGFGALGQSGKLKFGFTDLHTRMFRGRVILAMGTVWRSWKTISDIIYL